MVKTLEPLKKKKKAKQVKIGVLGKSVNYIKAYSLYSFARNWLLGKSYEESEEKEVVEAKPKSNYLTEKNVLDVQLEDINPVYSEKEDIDIRLPKNATAFNSRTRDQVNRLGLDSLRKSFFSRLEDQRKTKRAYHRFENLKARCRLMRREELQKTDKCSN